MSRAEYPPVCQAEIIGYVTESSGIQYSRDIGRSFKLGGHVYYFFGDTFCNNNDGDYVGVQSNTVAIVRNEDQPTQTTYLCIDDKGVVEPLIPLIPEEIRLQEQSEGLRVTLWGFGGVAEIDDGVGLVWYQKGIYKQNDQSHEYLGIGLAKITVDRATGVLRTHRFPGLLFGPDEPLIGSFSCMMEDPYIYLYGKIQTRMIIARVYKFAPDRRHAYTFFDGASWNDAWQTAATLFSEMYQGGIIRSALFGEEKPWILVGNNKWVDNQIQVGAAPHLEGPWEIFPVAEAKAIDHGDGGGMYCIYPHDWASNQKDAELMVTWSEHWPGGVVAARLRFASEEAPCAEDSAS